MQFRYTRSSKMLKPSNLGDVCVCVCVCVCVSSLTALRVRLQFYSGGLVLPLMIHEAVTLGRY